ncbi:hypothetical protein AwDysgo_16850 [Bacteroidales bacterium]|nr:hypothetical protein AwDysgo_16850 [Bacteroidales bacterium]
MKKNVILLLNFILFTFISLSINAQERSEDGFLNKFGVGVKLGTYGPGIDVHTSLTKNIKARVGLSLMSYTYTGDVDFTGHYTHKDYPTPIAIPGTISDFKFKFFNTSLLFDYYPMESGIFSLTAGVYLGDNSVKSIGKITDYEAIVTQYPEAEEFEIDGYTFKPYKNGSFDINIALGETIKPYFGFGLGRTIPKSKLGFKFDLGMIYQGMYDITSPNTEMDLNEKTESEDIDLPFSRDLLKWWPMISFGLNYRF